MDDEFPWLALLEVLAKFIATASLFAYLLHRGGLRPAAVIVVTLVHVMLLFCMAPVAPAELVFVTVVTFGTCAYTILAVDRLWLQVGIVVACFATLGVLRTPDSRALFLVSIVPLGFWTGFLVIIRDWARTGPKST